MKRIDFIVQSTTEPGINNLWIKDNLLYYYNNGKWTPLSSDVSSDIDKITEIIQTVIYNDSNAIDSLKEIESFLQGITDTETLTGLLRELKEALRTHMQESIEELKKDIDSEFNVPIVQANGTTLSAISNKYYRFDEPIEELTITLPTIEDTTKVQSFVVFFTTGDTPAITITSESNEVAYLSGYSIVPNTTYELNIMFNGLKWIVAHGTIN